MIILASAHFMSVQTDGSQARKTGTEKWFWSEHREMVIARS